ncbi:MAG: cell wall-active antibiotics response protein [Bacteroidales bacterium]|nr:cell wall-active antibiotics response protein [Bacteroidales bacterium]
MMDFNDNKDGMHNKRKNKKCYPQSETGRALTGLFILVIGVALIFRSIGLFEYFIDQYIFEWPVILIAAGVISLLSKPNKGPGIILLSLGLVFYLKEINFFHLGFDIVVWQVIVAIILLLFGFSLIFLKKPIHKKDKDKDVYKDSESDDENEIIDEVAVLGGGDRNILTDNFRGGRFIGIFGGSNFYMKGCSLAPGKNVLNVICVFGGFKMVIPEDWNVQIKTTSIFGGINDKRRYHDDPNIIHANQLIIRGLLIFGGGDIKR